MITLACIDASVLVKVLTREEQSETAANLLSSILRREMPVILPDIALLEVGSVLRQKVHRGLLTAAQADHAWHWFRKLQLITYTHACDYADRAWEISTELGLPVLYDGAYLAVAENAVEETGTACEFWTADQKLFGQVKERKPYVKLLGSG